jgi:hypothetical protein
MLTRLLMIRGRLALSAIKPVARMNARVTPGPNQRRAVVGEQRAHCRAEQNDQHEEQVTAPPAPAGDVQRRPTEEARLVQDQTDDDQGDKGQGRVPDDGPDHGNVGGVDDAGKQRQHRAQGRAPADAQTFGLPPRAGLPDHQNQGQEKDQNGGHHRTYRSVTAGLAW